ncbi:hypothetical protein vBSdyM006_104 [Shigella phage vB_SdyM_006]|nr:hypothetical protein vBSdyM006_104 [Shigella phage vB_SdyM_006]
MNPNLVIEIGSTLKIKTTLGYKDCYIYNSVKDRQFTIYYGFLLDNGADRVLIVYDTMYGYRGDVSWSESTQFKYSLNYTLSIIEDIKCI